VTSLNATIVFLQNLFLPVLSFESKIFQKSNLTEERKQNHKKETGIENTAKCMVAGQSVSRELRNTDTLVNNRWRSYLRQTLMCVVV
jgi:hypothetical protein